MILKNLIRYYLGLTFRALGLTGLTKQYYLFNAKRYLSQFPDHLLRGAWVRRSVTNTDFVPFWSDLDLTILIPETQVSDVPMPQDILHKDLQIIPEFCFSEWIQAGGIRNRQSGTWIGLTDTKLESPPSTERSILAFELGHEIYLLYHQLEKKLHQFPDPFVKVAKDKLISELNRMKQFWTQGDESILTSSRSNFISTQNLSLFFHLQDSFWGELLKTLQTPLNSFEAKKLLIKQHQYGYEINLQVEGKKVLILEDLNQVGTALKNFPNHFLATENFINLIKGIGVQEQDLLNQLAEVKDSYYFKFNIQRLSIDLVGASLQSPQSQIQLFYCFKNIQEFLVKLNTKSGPDWDSIELKWMTKGIIHQNQEELASLVQRHLEVLKSLR